ncbi:MAG: glycoside hydrolase family 9 protein [Bacteroidales bacterium]|nr:glycoside hydrolase family 9 protein [Bacteroidales bacterium]
MNLLTLAVLFIGVFCQAQTESVLIPQTGYLAGMGKVAVIRVPADSFWVTSAGNKVVLKGKLSENKEWSFSGEKVQLADLSVISAVGDYTLSIRGTNQSRVFGIYQDPYGLLANAAVKALYYNRCSYPILPEFGGKWARKAGHPDTKVYVHASAATEARPEGFELSSPGGWYDAGDYNKYIVNSGISTYTMMLAWDMYPEYWKSRNLNIPESCNGLPDLVDEMLYNLRWMLTMQDTDGGVYHKCSTLQFEGFVMPDEAKNKRFVIQKNTAASLDFAATMAHAARLLQPFSKELPGLADSCKKAAVKAWEWCRLNPAILYTQPKDVGTGAYGDNNISDEWFWAGVEMSLLTNSAFPDSLLEKLEFKTPTWNNVGQLGLITALTNKGQLSAETIDRCNNRFMQYADKLIAIANNAAYPVSLDFFAWGSNSDVANQGLLKMVAYEVSGDKKFLQSAINDMNYLTGVNPTGYCYITGFGEKSSMNIHHRPSGADGIVDPVPGFLAGGPNTVVMTDCPDVKRSKFPALSYVDELCSYSTNEIAINWNTPLVFLAGAVSYAGTLRY